MDENGDIYTLDFKFLTNMGENVIIEDWLSSKYYSFNKHFNKKYYS